MTFIQILMLLLYMALGVAGGVGIVVIAFCWGEVLSHFIKGE